MPLVALVSSGGAHFSVDVHLAEQSQTLRRLIEDLNIDDDQLVKYPIDLPKVPVDTLQLVIEWWTAQATIDKGGTISEAVEWAKKLVKMDNTSLFNLIIAANYLDCQELLQISCRAVASMIENKSPDEIRQTFGIVSDLSAEEDEQIRKENAWIHFARPAIENAQPASDDAREEPFPLMNLPNEILAIILTQLPIISRLCARVNRRLYLLEQEGRYSIDQLFIGRTSPTNPIGQRSVFMRLDCPYYSDGLAKIAANSTTESLVFACELESDSALFPYLKCTPARNLKITSFSYALFTSGPEVNTDECFEQWAQDRESLDICGVVNLSPAGLYRVFENIASSRITLKHFRVYIPPKCRKVMPLLGLTLLNNRTGAFTSTRRDVRIFLCHPERGTNAHYCIVFGESMRITISKRVFGSRIGPISIEKLDEERIREIVAEYEPLPVTVVPVL